VFNYASNNPVKYVDLDGRTPTSDIEIRNKSGSQVGQVGGSIETSVQIGRGVVDAGVSASTNFGPIENRLESNVQVRPDGINARHRVGHTNPLFSLDFELRVDNNGRIRLEAELANNEGRVIFRKDFGEDIHPIRPDFPESLTTII
jgi:hypothetical protein